MANPSLRRVVVTGIGIVSPLGKNREEGWQRLSNGESGLHWLNEVESTYPVGQIVPDNTMLTNTQRQAQPDLRNAHSTTTTTVARPQAVSQGLLAGGTAQQFLTAQEGHQEPVIQFALQTAHEALQDAHFQIDDSNRQRFGCAIGTSKGGFQSVNKSVQHFASDQDINGPLPGWETFPANRAAVEVAQSFDLQGAVLCPVAACATGLVSLMQGANLITNGYCDTVLAGSSDASLQQILLGSYDRMGVLANNFDNPETACRPFDKTRNGFLVGEGAAMFLLEEASTAKARGAKPYAEWITGNLATDISGLTTLENDAASLTWLIKNVLQQAKMSPSEIDYINLHGTATSLNDLYETNGLNNACGKIIHNTPCSSLKGAIGHLMGAAGSVETAFSLLAMRDNIVPPTLNLTTPDPQCNLNYTPNITQLQEINSLLKLSFGFGGHLAAAVFRAV